HWFLLSQSMTCLFRSFAISPGGMPLGQSCWMASVIPCFFAPGPGFDLGAAGLYGTDAAPLTRPTVGGGMSSKAQSNRAVELPHPKNSVDRAAVQSTMASMVVTEPNRNHQV